MANLYALHAVNFFLFSKYMSFFIKMVTLPLIRIYTDFLDQFVRF